MQAAQVLDKKIPQNPKFKNVRSKLDTGQSASKHQERVDYIKKNFKYRKDEIFRRIKATTLVQLIVEVEESKLDQQFDEAELDEAGKKYALFSTLGDVHQRFLLFLVLFADFVRQKYHENFLRNLSASGGKLKHGINADGVITGMGEMQAQDSPRRVAVDTSRPYLLIDARDTDDYEKCHIAEAKSFPYTRLSRATNMLTPEVLAYKNKEGSVIVVYDEDETVAPRVATTLVQQGIDNLFMLSGGLVVGELPPSCRPKKHAPPSPGHVVLGSLTRSNLETVRSQLEANLLADDVSSMASTRTSRMNTPRTSGMHSKPTTARSSTSIKPSWK
eukprot:gene7914-10007_t